MSDRCAFTDSRRNPGTGDRIVRVRETSPGVWEPDEHGTHVIRASMLPLQDRKSVV